jgi:hypothetical protein
MPYEEHKNRARYSDADIEHAKKAERERCAKIAETEWAVSPSGKDSGDRIAAKIREL